MRQVPERYRNCVDCKWFSRGHLSSGEAIVNATCMYWDEPGHGLRGCPPGDGCTRKEIGTRKKHRSISIAPIGDEHKTRRVLMTEEVKAKMQEAYDMGMADKEIAEYARVYIKRVRKWRNENNLPWHTGRCLSRLDPMIDRRRRRMWDDGMTDAQIAAEEGVAKTAICSWRHRNGLKPNVSAREQKTKTEDDSMARPKKTQEPAAPAEQEVNYVSIEEPKTEMESEQRERIQYLEGRCMELMQEKRDLEETHGAELREVREQLERILNENAAMMVTIGKLHEQLDTLEGECQELRECSESGKEMLEIRDQNMHLAERLHQMADERECIEAENAELVKGLRMTKKLVSLIMETLGEDQ